MPCHRSHMDYLLLSYVLYHRARAAAHRRGHQPQLLAGRPDLPPHGRVLHPPHLQGQQAVLDGVPRIPRRAVHPRLLGGILCGRWPFPHRASSGAEDRHPVDDHPGDAARRHPSDHAGADLHRLRARDGSGHLRQRAARRHQGKESLPQMLRGLRKLRNLGGVMSTSASRCR